MLRVGLTGGIACGKSHVLQRLAARGARTLDLDLVSRDVSARGSPAFAEIVSAFGREVVGPDGSLNRAALAARVFEDEAARRSLNAIVHPRVRAAEAAWAADFAGRALEVLVTDGALLVEAGVHLRFDRLVVVHCDESAQLARLRARDGLDARAALARIGSQMPLVEKRTFAHFEVDTSGSVADTNRRADELAEELTAVAHESRRGPGATVETLLGGLVHGAEDGPRGLSPDVLLAEAAEAGGLEMERLAGRLRPPASRPWYRTAAEAEPGAPATRLSVPLAAWALRRGAVDPPFLAAAMGTLARLVHGEAAVRADACLLALVAQEVARAREPARSRDSADVEGLAERFTPLAVRCGGGAPSGRLAAVWTAVRRWPDAPAAAGAECETAGGDATLASALAGLGSKVEPSARAVSLRVALTRVPPTER